MQKPPRDHRSAAAPQILNQAATLGNPLGPETRLQRDRKSRASARDRDGLFECARLLHELTRDGSLTRRTRLELEAELAQLVLVTNRGSILDFKARLRRLYML